MLNYPELDCHSCDEVMREERGHDKEGIMYFWIGKQQVKRCPLTLITNLSWDYIQAFRLYEKGFLPNGKGWIFESNKYIQAMNILENEFNKARNTESGVKISSSTPKRGQ